MRLVHYSAEQLGEIKFTEQWLKPHFKPRGLWVSVDSCEENWRWWCEAESFSLQSLAQVHDIALAPTANVLELSSAEGIDRFTEQFGASYDFMTPRLQRKGQVVRWAEVAQQYDGIIIAPYIWGRRLHAGTEWYYPWDCASGCIWEPRAVADVKLRA